MTEVEEFLDQNKSSFYHHIVNLPCKVQMHAQGSIDLAVSFDGAGEVYYSFARRRTQHACEFHNL